MLSFRARVAAYEVGQGGGWPRLNRPAARVAEGTCASNRGAGEVVINFQLILFINQVFNTYSQILTTS